MMQELAEFLYKDGNSIKVLTSMPQLNLIDMKTKIDLLESSLSQIVQDFEKERELIKFQNE